MLIHLHLLLILWPWRHGCQSWYRGSVLVWQTLNPQSYCSMLFPFTVARRGNNRMLTAQLIRRIIQREAYKRMIVTPLSSFSLLLLLILFFSLCSVVLSLCLCHRSGFEQYVESGYPQYPDSCHGEFQTVRADLLPEIITHSHYYYIPTHFCDSSTIVPEL